MRIGIMDNSPWTIRTAGEPEGVEAVLVRRFAEEIGARPVWIWGNEHKLMKALELYELDLVIGGVVNSSPWSSKVGITRPYIISRTMVGFPRGMVPSSEISGLKIGVRIGDSAAVFLEKEGALAERVLDPFDGAGPVAALEWELDLHGYTRSDIELHKEEHVMAVAPGENRWLTRLDRFLQSNRASVRQLFMKEMQPL
jgi:hypothetical protein